MKYHMAQALVDHCSDRFLKKNVLPGLLIDGRRPTLAEFRAACDEARVKGYEVLPPCDHVDEKGLCMGHPEPEELKRGKSL